MIDGKMVSKHNTNKETIQRLLTTTSKPIQLHSVAIEFSPTSFLSLWFPIMKDNITTALKVDNGTNHNNYTSDSFCEAMSTFLSIKNTRKYHEIPVMLKIPSPVYLSRSIRSNSEKKIQQL